MSVLRSLCPDNLLWPGIGTQHEWIIAIVPLITVFEMDHVVLTTPCMTDGQVVVGGEAGDERQSDPAHTLFLF